MTLTMYLEKEVLRKQKKTNEETVISVVLILIYSN